MERVHHSWGLDFYTPCVVHMMDDEEFFAMQLYYCVTPVAYGAFNTLDVKAADVEASIFMVGGMSMCGYLAPKYITTELLGG